ncbi:hypothetical protein GEMRC1_013890 [Eukaryota sp. GEM-RC1]
MSISEEEVGDHESTDTVSDPSVLNGELSADPHLSDEVEDSESHNTDSVPSPSTKVSDSTLYIHIDPLEVTRNESTQQQDESTDIFRNSSDPNNVDFPAALSEIPIPSTPNIANADPKCVQIDYQNSDNVSSESYSPTDNATAWQSQPIIEPTYYPSPPSAYGPAHDLIKPSHNPTSSLHESKFNAVDPQLLHSVTDQVKKYSTWFWPTVGAATALLILLGLILIVLPIFSSRSELRKAIRITADLDGSTVTAPSSTQEDRTVAVLDFIESKLENLNIDVDVRFSSTSESYTVTLRTTTSFSVQDRLTLRNIYFELSERGQVSITMNQLKENHMSSLQFSIDPFSLTEMIHQLELYFIDTIESVLTSIRTSKNIFVSVVHIRNHITFRLTLTLNDYDEEQVFDVEFLYTNDLAVSEAIDLLKDELSMTVELEVADFDYETPMKDYVAHILIDNHFHDFEISVNHLHDREFRITLARGSSSMAHTFHVALVVIDLDEIKADLLEMSAKVNEHEQQTKMKCITTIAAYTQAHQRRYALRQLVESIVDNELYMINVQSSGWTWIVTLSRASLHETVEVTAFFRDSQFTSVSQVSVGNKFSAVLSSTGSLFMFGLGNYGQLGVSGSRSVPIATLDSVKAVSTGNRHTIVLLNNGQVLASGGNFYGQLGQGHTTDRSSFVNVLSTCGGSTVTEVYAGFDSSAAVSGAGKYICVWGRNHKQQMMSETGDLLSVWRWTMQNTVLKVAIGVDHLLVLSSTRGILSRGGNYWGQLGDESRTDRTTWRTVRRHRLLWTNTDMDAVYYIAAGSEFSIAARWLGSNWGFYSWGRGGSGRLLSGSTSQDSAATERFTYSGQPRGLFTGDMVTLILTSAGNVHGL